MLSPTFLEWDESSVQDWFIKNGHGQYADVVIDQGITGDVLSLLDTRSLSDLGINSLGHRLSILRAIWEMKLDQGVEIGVDEWRPSDEARFSISSYTPSQNSTSTIQPYNSNLITRLTTSEANYSPTSTVDPMMAERMWEVIAEQNERIATLESDIQRLFMESNSIQKYDDNRRYPRVEVSRDRQRDGEVYRENGRGFGSRINQDDDSATIQANPQSRMDMINSSIRNAEFSNSIDTIGHAPTQSKTSDNNHNKSITTPSQPPLLNRTISSTGIISTTPQTQSFSPYVQSDASTPIAHGTPSAANKSLISNTSTSGLPSSISTTPAATSAPISGGSSSSSAQKDAVSAAKSFKVTLEDPCWKVLPAALKKYKIIDDWRQYAMFICFGNTERCLSYDEKPLLLFQKLKEANQKPVFMLRHIRDIKSPIAVAQQKQAARTASRNANAQSSSVPNTTATSLTPGTSNPHPYSKDTRLHRPPVLQPISAKAKAAQASGSGKTTPGSSGAANFPELPSPGIRTAGVEGYSMGDEQDGDRKVSYAVAIYPYVAEREDEFDVSVGATFSILNKAKGWWVVQKDPEGTGATSTDESLSGWVPAGCLLELSRPVADISTKSSPDDPAGTKPIPHGCVISSSFPGIALMDYSKKGEDELDLKRDDLLRVFKRYNFYSYCILESTGRRGWCPSWYISKVIPSEGDAKTSEDKTNGIKVVDAEEKSVF